MFSKVVLDVEGDLFENAIIAMKLDARRAQRHRPVRRGPQASSSTQFKEHRRRARRRRRSSRSSRVDGKRRVPAGRRDAAAPRDRGRLQELDERRARSTTARWRRSPTTSAPRSTSSRWSSATRARLGHRRRLHAQPGRRHQGVLRRLPHQRAGRGRRRRHPQHRADRRAQGRACLEGRRRARRGLRRRSSSTTATCATSSSPSSRASCGCCRRASASAPRARRSRSPSTWSTRA